MAKKVGIKSNLRQAVAVNRERRKDLKNFSGPLGKIGTRVFQIIQRNFQTSGGAHKPNLDPWAPLKPATLRQKAKLGFSSKPLIRTGQLKQRWRIVRGRTAVRISSQTGYSGVHQKGSKKNKIPARPFMPSEKQVENIAVKEFGNHVKFALTSNRV